MDENIIKKKLDGYLIKNYSINLENSLKNLKIPFQNGLKIINKIELLRTIIFKYFCYTYSK